ncbi:Multiple epidermal growth factor-like domains protein 10 [Holothuria leucospilota]|uniref:Multiple epidermal growth factor-like domains protein 10 n=1 Tax=Holothuria leucospilota TaxID=206669 RepID=A0A9Q1H5A1_HOLLE|nr:Multiple epidermal growth factor-like domains protein 10 [Holothuria leucospilota]
MEDRWSIIQLLSHPLITVLLCMVVSQVSLAADTWTHAPSKCDVVLEAGFRCHWPDAYFKCECTSGAFCSDHMCKCLEGLTGDMCDQGCAYQLEDPFSCLESCSNSSCQLETTCHQGKGTCFCMEGYSGPDCNLCNGTVLPEVCTTCGGVTCQNNGKCDIVTETCFCQDGYLSPPSGIQDCSYCDPHEHSNNCLEHCMYHCKKGFCDTAIGTCRCPKAFSGYDCSWCDPTMDTEQCATSCNGIVCLNDGLCNITKRECVCPPGYYGMACGFCNQTSHKQLCSNYCPMICKYGRCDTSLRQCICDAGYDEMNCEHCIPSSHPKQCLNHCDFVCVNGGYCDTSSARCVCPDGYIGEDCSVCDPILHLENCTSHCQDSCINNATCDTLSNVCECLPGWEGQSCHKECQEGFFGKNCSNPCPCKGWPCDHISGECFIVTTPSATTTLTFKPRPATHTTHVFPPLVSSINGKPSPDSSSTRPMESPSTILLFAFLFAILLVLVILAAGLYARKRYKRNHFPHPEHNDIPLNNIVIPVTDGSSVEGENDYLPAETPLVERDSTPQPISNSFRGENATGDTEDSRVPLVKPNPRKSTNLDVDAQRLYAKGAAQNFDASFKKPPKDFQINRNIFDEKEALTRDKLKNSNYEEPDDVTNIQGTEKLLKQEALEAVEVSEGGERELSRQGGSQNRRLEDGKEKPTDSGFCEDSSLEGAVGGLSLSAGNKGGYESLALDSDSGNSEDETKDENIPPFYAQVDFSKKGKGDSLMKSDYQHLDRSIGKDSDVEEHDPSYAELEVPVKMSKGYSRLEYEPKRKAVPEMKMVEENQYAKLMNEEEADEDSDGDTP